MNKEKVLYFYARNRAKILSLLPGKKKEENFAEEVAKQMGN